MNLVPYIFIFFPSLIGISFYNKLSKKKKFNIIKYLIYVLLSNMIVLLILKYFTSFNGDIYNQLAIYSHYAFRYSLLLIFINLIIGFLDFTIVNYINFDIEVVNEKKH